MKNMSQQKMGFFQLRDLPGCFIEGTRIRLEDGSEIAIEEFCGEEFVGLADGTGSTLHEGLTGPAEQPILSILTSHGQRLGVTATHPMVVERQGELEIVAASALGVGDRLPAFVGCRQVRSQIQSIEQKNYAGTVYNIQVRGGIDPETHFIIANGIVTGDLYLQMQIEKTATCAA